VNQKVPVETPSRRPLAAALREARGDRTIDSVAKRAKITAVYLSQIEREEKPNVGNEVLRRLAVALHLRYSYLLRLAKLQQAHVLEEKRDELLRDAGVDVSSDTSRRSA
jgi:transcriptional regulator with XRE-family HTH domain